MYTAYAHVCSSYIYRARQPCTHHLLVAIHASTPPTPPSSRGSVLDTRTPLREEEKECTSWILLALVQRPHTAPLLSALAARCGSALADYLLQQCEWVLQDPNTTTGRHSLASVVQGRCGGDPNTAPHTPFALERGLCEMVLLGLLANTPARRRDVTQQAVSQLGMMVAMLEGGREGKADADGGDAGAEGATRAVGLGTGRLRRSSQAAHTPGRCLSAAHVTAAQRHNTGPASGVQAALWLRLQLLLPLLPVVYADKEADAALNLRSRLAHICAHLCLDPVVWADPDDGSAAAGTARAAAAQAGEPLFSRLVHVLAAMLADDWASWVRGDRKLRAVAELPGLAQLHESLLRDVPPSMPWRLQARLLAAVPLPSALPRCMPGAGGACPVPCWVMHRLGEGVTGGGVAGVAAGGPVWLTGCVQRPRGCMTYNA